MKKLCSLLLALSLTLFCAVPAAGALTRETLSPSSSGLVLVVNQAITQARAGVIVAMTSDTTYVLTEPLSFADAPTPYLCFKMLFDEEGNVNEDNLIQSELVWVNSGLTLGLLAVETSEDVYAGHRAFPALAPRSSLNSGDMLYRVGLNITGDNSVWSTFGLFVSAAGGEAVLSPDDSHGLFAVDSPLELVDNDELLYLGGPVIDEEGVMVGVSTYVLDDELGTELVADLDELIDYLDSEDIPYAARGFCGDVTEKGKISIIPVSEENQETGPSQTPEETGRSGGSGGGLLEDALSGGAIGLVAAGVAGAFLWLKKKKAPGQTAQKAGGTFSDPVDPAGGGGPALMGTGGQMDGCRFPLQGTNLSFGRDPSRCSVVYDSGAPGVSSLHCQLICQEGTWSLIDLESSYGTYLNGRRLEPFTPAPLHPGDTFWLGQSQNSFTFKEG